MPCLATKLRSALESSANVSGIRGAVRAVVASGADSSVSTIRYSGGMTFESSSASALIRDARRRAGLSQAQLAVRAGVTQSVVSAYESGSRQPSLPTLKRLVHASGLRLDLRVSRPASPLRRLRGPLGRRVRAHRTDIVRLAGTHGATNVRVFGSVARGEESSNSDIDLLVDLAPGTGLVGLARLERDLHALLGADVDIVPADDLKVGVAENALAEAVAL